MRTAEWVNTVAFTVLMLLVWSRRLEPRKRTKITLLGSVGLALTFLSAAVLPRVLPPLPASVSRDWLPYVLLLLFYWQAGQFFVEANAEAEHRLEWLDQRMVSPLLPWLTGNKAGHGILVILEGAYLFCYPSLPLGLAALYLMHRGRDADHYWAVVLVSTYICYGALPFLQTRPPRMLKEPDSLRPRSSAVRSLNLWILRHASIQVNTFPSAHAAGSLAGALVLLHFAPPVGVAFLALALCIALGAVAGRYHYGADVMAGFMVAVAAFLVESSRF